MKLEVDWCPTAEFLAETNQVLLPAPNAGHGQNGNTINSNTTYSNNSSNHGTPVKANYAGGGSAKKKERGNGGMGMTGYTEDYSHQMFYKYMPGPEKDDVVFLFFTLIYIY